MNRPREIARAPSVSAGVFLLGTLLIIDSFHFVFARLLLPHISPGVSAMYVLGIGTLEVGAIGWLRGRLRLKTLRKDLGFFLVIGFLVAANTNINYEAVAFIDPGAASLLGKTSVLFSLGLGLFWLRERLSPAQLAGAALAVAGAFAIAFQPGDYWRLGSLLVLLSSFMYALHAAIVKRHGSEIDFLNFFFFRLLCTAGFLFLFALGRGELAWPSLRAWPLLVLVGTVSVGLGRMLYYLALRWLEMSVHSIVLTLTPVATVLWSLLLFDVVPSSRQLVGGAAVIGGVLIVTVQRNRKLKG
jgi:drug/metabolite transporter (DMT)-like permease